MLPTYYLLLLLLSVAVTVKVNVNRYITTLLHQKIFPPDTNVSSGNAASTIILE